MNYERIYHSLIERAKTRVLGGYVERHHIIPKCLGGSDNFENLVALTPEEHFLCHVLLVKMYPSHPGLIYAVRMMSMACSQGRKSRKIYGWLKRKFIEQRKIDAAGQNNHRYGKMWINKIGTTENKSIPASEDIPEGWIRGRRLSLVEKPNKIPRCPACGLTDCNTEYECSKFRIAVQGLSKYFGFDTTTIKTEKFPKELVRVKSLIETMYNDRYCSVEDLKNHFGVPTNEAMRSIMRSLDIQRRCLSQAYVASKEKLTI